MRTVTSASGDTLVRAFPARFSTIETTIAVNVPRLGEHTRCLAGEIGIEKKMLDKMIEQGGLVATGGA